MSVKANWNLADLDVSGADPMQDISSGKLVDLSRPVEEIHAELAELLSREAYLWRVPKIRCPMKQEDADITQVPPCATCPDYDPTGAIGRLCKVGVKQVDLLEELEAAKTNDRLDEEMDTRLHAECEELAAACL